MSRGTRIEGMRGYGLPGVISNHQKRYTVTMNYYVNNIPKDSISIRDFRVKVLKFMEDYGLKAAMAAFNISRSSLYEWRRMLGGNTTDQYIEVDLLIPKSTRPHHHRTSRIDYRINDEIIRLREQHPSLGKAKLESLLYAFCKANNLAPISESTIGRQIGRLKKRGLLPTHSKLGLRAKTGALCEKPGKKKKKLRRKDYYPKQAGDLIQLDCITKIKNGIRRYIISAIDHRSSFTFSYAYTNLSSASAANFFTKLQHIAPFAIRHVQTDNGQEFHKRFDELVREQAIIHFWNYPRTPKSNGKIERYNRTKQEEYVDAHLDELFNNIDAFNRGLMDYLIFYNTERPHEAHREPALGITGKPLKHGRQISPMRALLTMLQLDQGQSEMCWTCTNP